MTFIFGIILCLFILAVALSTQPGRKDSLRTSLSGFYPLAAGYIVFLLVHTALPEGHGFRPILDYSLSCLYLFTILNLRGHGFKAWYFLPLTIGLTGSIVFIILPLPFPLLPDVCRLVPLAGIAIAMIVAPRQGSFFPRPWFLSAAILGETLFTSFFLPWPRLVPLDLVLLDLAALGLEFSFRLFSAYQVLMQERRSQDQSLTLYRDYLLNISQVLQDPENARILWQDMVNGLGSIIPTQGAALILLNGKQEGHFTVKSLRGKVDFSEEIFIVQEDDPGSPASDPIYRLAPHVLRQLAEKGRTWQSPEKPGLPRHLLIPLVQDERFYGLFIHQSDPRQNKHIIPESTFNSFIHSSALAVASMEAFTRSSRQVSASAEIQLSRFIQDLCFKANPKGFSSRHGSAAIYHQREQDSHSDYLDCIIRKNGQFCGIVSDTAGSGLESALLTFMIRTLFQLFAPADRSPAEILSWMNRATGRKLKLDRFANTLVWCWNPSSRVLTWASAGTVHAFVIPAIPGPGRILAGDQALLGMEADILYENQEMNLETGDILSCFTDGLVECRNPAGTPYGIANLMNSVSANRNLDTQGMISAATADIKNYCSPESDHYQDEKSLMLFKIQA